MITDQARLKHFVDWWMKAIYEHDAEMRVAMALHKAWWGVPIGPTMSMAYPPKLRGILAEVTP